MAKLDQLRGVGTGKRFEKGAVMAQDGDLNREMTLLLKGEAGVFTGYGTAGQQQTATLAAGDFFGEAGLFLGQPHSGTVVALTDGVALALSHRDALNLFKSQPENALELVSAVCARLTGLDDLRDAPAAAPPAAPTGAPAKAEAPSAPAMVGPESESPLFLPGHKHYALPLLGQAGELLFEKNHTCPQCGTGFKAWAVKTSRLVTEKTDPDRRTRYKGIEPLYYDVVTCPKCWYSAAADAFGGGIKRPAQVAQALEPYREALVFPTGLDMDASTVFAGHYLAIACAPLTQPAPKLMLGKLWQKLSRIYADCGDPGLEQAAAQNAYEAYMEAYTKTNIAPRQNQQLCVLIAELALKLGDVRQARDFFFKAKTDPSGSPMLKRHSEDRIEDLRAMGDSQ